MKIVLRNVIVDDVSSITKWHNSKNVLKTVLI